MKFSETYWSVCMRSTMNRKGPLAGIKGIGDFWNRYKILGALCLTLADLYRPITRKRFKTEAAAKRALKRIPEIDRQFYYVSEGMDMSF